MDRLFIFDIGEVVMTECKTLRDVARDIDVDALDFIEDFRALNSKIMEGAMGIKEYYAHLSEKFSVKADDSIFLNNYHPYENKVVLEEIKRIKRSGSSVVYGSNTFEPYSSWFKENMREASSLPDFLFLSNEIHLSKPNGEFYEFILKHMGFKAENAFFIDDREENVDAAERLGIRSYRYRKDDADFKAFISKCLL